MKKNLRFRLLTAFLAISALGFAQNNPIDFETGGYGADWTWTVFENGTDPELEFIANPDQSGINTSATVAKFTAKQDGQTYAGCESAHGADDLGPFVLGTDNSTIKIMVWKSVISDVGIKLVSSNGWAQVEIKKPNTVTDAWEELTFDFSSYTNPPAEEGQLDQIVVFPDFSDRGQDNVVYFDNITFNEAIVSSEGPETPAPTPPERDAGDVISMFSDAYTDVSVDTWLTAWSAAVLADIDIEGNAVKKYTTLDFAGIETTTNQVDVSDMTHLHVDVWSDDFTLLKIKLVDFGADGAYEGGDDVEHEVTIDAPAQGEWVSLDIPLTDFTGLTTKENLAQYILTGQPTGATTVYVDNMYFYKQGLTTNTVVDIIVNSADHETLETAVTTADLAGTLSGDGPFTVFAPTDAAFDLLPDGTLTALLADPSGDLTDILQYHVIGSKVLSTDLTDGQTATTLFGEDVEVTINDDGVFINDAKVTTADLVADNGVVHVIDAVLTIPTGILNNDVAKIAVYPNPAESSLFIDGLSTRASVKIFDMGGKLLVKKQNVSKGIDVENLSKGVYFIQIMDNNAVITRKFIKE